MNFSPKCRTKKLGIYTNLGGFDSFLNWEIRPQIRPRKISGLYMLMDVHFSPFITLCLVSFGIDHIISEPCYEGTILKRNCRKMTFSCSCIIESIKQVEEN